MLAGRDHAPDKKQYLGHDTAYGCSAFITSPSSSPPFHKFTFIFPQPWFFPMVQSMMPGKSNLCYTISRSDALIFRCQKPFAPPTFTLKQIHDAVPKDLLRRNPWLSVAYVIRDVAFSVALCKFATMIKPWSASNFSGMLSPGWQVTAAETTLWLAYWWFQGLVWAGIFCLGHDAGHGSLFASSKMNNAVGFVLHTVR